MTTTATTTLLYPLISFVVPVVGVVHFPRELFVVIDIVSIAKVVDDKRVERARETDLIHRLRADFDRDLSPISPVRRVKNQVECEAPSIIKDVRGSESNY